MEQGHTCVMHDVSLSEIVEENWTMRFENNLNMILFVASLAAYCQRGTNPRKTRLRESQELFKVSARVILGSRSYRLMGLCFLRVDRTS